MKQYHPLLVTLHWLLAIMIVIGLVLGGNVLSATSNSDAQKLFYLKMHMSAGMVILALMVIRLIVRLATTKPSDADIGNVMANKLGVATHYLFYLIVMLLAASGMATANMAGLPDIIFGDSGAALPASFDNIPPRAAHGILATLLILLIAGHVLAFLYHQFVRKDALLARMWFGKRN